MSERPANVPSPGNPPIERADAPEPDPVEPVVAPQAADEPEPSAAARTFDPADVDSEALVRGADSGKVAASALIVDELAEEWPTEREVRDEVPVASPVEDASLYRPSVTGFDPLAPVEWAATLRQIVNDAADVFEESQPKDGGNPLADFREAERAAIAAYRETLEQ